MSGWAPIPGETPIDDISGLIPQHVKTRRELNAVEAENIRKVFVRYLAGKPSRKQAPFHLTWCLKLHKQMFGDVWRWAGERRQRDLNLGLPHYQIDVAIQNALDDLAYWREQGDMDLLEQGARIHHRAVAIHPFLNGNGRWSRLLANIWLKQNGGVPVQWPETTLGDTSTIREEYLAAVRAADNGDYSAIIELHRRFATPI
jgi:Fic-DOC domain mobile mystery protein B